MSEVKKKSTTKKKTTTKKAAPKKTTPKKTTTKKTTTRKASLKQKKQAFTLIELLAVVIILGVIMVIAIPSITTYVSNSRKQSYVNTIKTISNGAKTIVNSGELPVYDMNATYFIPVEMIKTENNATSPYGDLEDAYIAVTYERDGYDYYCAVSDTKKMGIYLTYCDNLEGSSVVPNVDYDPTNISVCGKDHIIVFDENGNVKEEKDAEDCIEPRGEYVKEDLNTCTYKLATEYGSFSSTGDVKEVCVNLDTSYTYKTLSRYTESMYRCGSQDYVLLNVTIDSRKINNDFYFRVYDSSAKNQLLAEIKKSDFPKYTFYLDEASTLSYVGVTKVFPKYGSGSGYYVEYSDDYKAEFDARNASWQYYCVGEIPGEISYSGAWLKNPSDINKISTLADSLENIPLTSLCSNQNPDGGIWLNGFTNCKNGSCGGNTYYANIDISCERPPK